MSEVRIKEEDTIEQGSKWGGKRQNQDRFHFLYHFAGFPSCKNYSATKKARDDSKPIPCFIEEATENK